VSQHSVLVSRNSNPEDAKWGLLHDASEAYLVDLPTPFKILPEFSFFKEQEERLQQFIYGVFGLKGKEPPSVYNADKILLKTEKRDLMPKIDVEQLHYSQKPLDEHIIPMLPTKAKQFFLDEYTKLFKKSLKTK
jgi:5'-deoxynucleotidase YfbR-like HD superfamily hydrolase